jgi:LPS-assembly protein
MKNNFFFWLVLLVILFNYNSLSSNELKINATEVNVDNVQKIIILKGDVNAEDDQNNKLFSEFARYDKNKKILKTSGKTKIITSEGFILDGQNITFDNNKKIISSNYDSIIIDKEGNQIFLEMFEYIIKKNMFFSKGNIKVLDSKNNNYKFSEIYIDEKKNKIVGSDVKVFLNQEDIKINDKNEPRIFANSMILTGDQSELNKGVFTYCKNRKNDACPPWSLQADKIKHNSSNKTVYYDNAVLKIYDFPIFYFPKFYHPDPTVTRRSGFLNPRLTNSTNTGTGFSIPYFWSIAKDRDLTITPRYYINDNPLVLTEYRQDFKNSYLILDSSYTKGYKKTTNTKLSGSKSHLFSKFDMNLIDESNKTSNLEINLQKLSNDTYLKVHDINTELADSSYGILENNFNYNYQHEDLFFSSTLSAYQDLTVIDRSKYEYLLPYISFEKNLVTNPKYGFLDLASKIRVRNYDVNKQTEFLVNDFNWKSNRWISDSGFENQLLGIVKTVNYNAKNTDKYKTDETNSELSGVVGYLSKLNLNKKMVEQKNNYFLTPKILFRYAPGHMRNIDGGRLKYSNLFSLNKINQFDVLENGFSTSIGLDFKKNIIKEDGSLDKEIFNLSLGQVISEKENMDMPSSTSLDQKFSDIVGESSIKLNNSTSLKYNFSIDQSYKDINYSEIGADIDLNKNTKFNISYLEEKNHIGQNEYIKSNIDFEIGEFNSLSFSAKRNLLTNSAEFYNLSYDYINDCLKAGIVFRREFYSDRDIEPDNSLMFRISIVPFANINSPKVSR